MKKIIAVTAVALALAGLSGCIPSKLATTISDDERAAYQAACNSVRGTFHGNLPHEVPTCYVEYTYPAIPNLETVDGSQR